MKLCCQIREKSYEVEGGGEYLLYSTPCLASLIGLRPFSLYVSFLFPGLVLFLEEDHHVSEDFLHVLKLADEERKRNTRSNCDIICLGTYMKNLNYARNHKTVRGRKNDDSYCCPVSIINPRFGTGAQGDTQTSLLGGWGD